MSNIILSHGATSSMATQAAGIVTSAPVVGDIASTLGLPTDWTSSSALPNPFTKARETLPTTMSLLEKAKNLTAHLMDGAVLPQALIQYKDIAVILLSTGAILNGVRVVRNIRRRYRQSMAMALCHFIRLKEEQEDLQERLKNPQELIDKLMPQVNALTEGSLSGRQLNSSLTQFLKRKRTLEDSNDAAFERAEAAKRPRHWGFMVLPLPTSPEAASGEAAASSAVDIADDDSDVSMKDVDMLSSPRPQLSSPVKAKSRSPRSKSFPEDMIGITYKVPSSSSSSSSSDSSKEDGEPSPKTKLSLAREQLSSEMPGWDEGKYMEQKLKRRRPVFSKLGRTLGNLPTGANAPPSLPRQPLIRPQTDVSRRAPPARRSMMHGELLGGAAIARSLRETASPQRSPTEGTSEFRVAESRKFYGDIEAKRQERRGARLLSNTQAVISPESASKNGDILGQGTVIPSIDSPPTPQEISPPLARSPSSSSSSLSPARSISSPSTPKAASPSPSLPSPSGAEESPLVVRAATAEESDAAPTPEVGINASPVTAPASSPAKSLRSSRRGGDAPKTPKRAKTLKAVQTPGTRKSTRASAYKGTFTK